RRSDSCSLSGRNVGPSSWSHLLPVTPIPVSDASFRSPLDAAPTPVPSQDGMLGRVSRHLYSLGVIPKDNDACRGSFTAEDGRSLLDTFLLSQVDNFLELGSISDCFWILIGNIMLGGVSLNTMSLPANLRWNAQFLKKFENNFLEPLGFIKSNYMKNCKDEILFCVCQGEKESSEQLPLTVLPKDGVLIITNGNPVEYGHVYLVPYVSHQLPLFWNRKILGLVTQIAVEVNNSSFRVFLDNASTTSVWMTKMQQWWIGNQIHFVVLKEISIWQWQAKVLAHEMKKNFNTKLSSAFGGGVVSVDEISESGGGEGGGDGDRARRRRAEPLQNSEPRRRQLQVSRCGARELLLHPHLPDAATADADAPPRQPDVRPQLENLEERAVHVELGRPTEERHLQTLESRAALRDRVPRDEA
ncbi:hypothetical protein ACMD2_20866, partial [Ananas comosus]